MKFFFGFFLCVILFSCKKFSDRPQITVVLTTQKWSPESDFEVWKIKVESALIHSTAQKFKVYWGLNKAFDWQEEIVLPANTLAVAIDTYVPVSVGDKIDYVTIK